MSGEELIENKCFECQNYDDYDGCLKSNLVYYNEEEECIECDEYEQVLSPEDEYWERYAYIENHTERDH